MGTITTRKRADGTEGHTAQIRIKRQGVVVHTEAKTFDRVQIARQWLREREADLAKPGALELLKQPDAPLADVIDHYIRETKRDIGKTKRQVLNTIKAASIAKRRCSTITSHDWITYLDSLNVQPQTAANYLAHISAIYTVAKPAWGYQLDREVIESVQVTAKLLGKVTRSRTRARVPSLHELDQLLTHFSRQARQALPMERVILFALFSTRRQAEITRLSYDDLEPEFGEIWVRDMKHPGEKEGNDVRCVLPPEALQIAELMRDEPRQPGDSRIFPFNEGSISAAFTRACTLLGIEDLHFHDLRHAGVSRLFEMGWSIPQVASVSGHRTWNSLKRYTHLRHAGDRYAGWVWLERVGIKPGAVATQGGA